MASETPLDKLWKEYSLVFNDFDDFTLARWLAQTLGQLEGKVWRLSHPLLGAYRLAAQVAHDRAIWSKRLATAPGAYTLAPCCSAPILPLFTRDLLETGLLCQHCGETCTPFDELDPALQESARSWANDYQPVHAVAHWEEDRRLDSDDYDEQLEDAADAAERLLRVAGKDLVPKFLESYPAIIWEDQDECLEIRPEDILT